MTDTKLAIKLAKCFNDVCYISSPITTGEKKKQFDKDFAHMEPSEAKSALFKELVVEPNLKAARDAVEDLKYDYNNIMCPANFYEPTWKQQDYIDFWTSVIANSVATVIFNTGWEHSHGCNEEFIKAHECGLDCRDESAILNISLGEGYVRAKAVSSEEPWWPEVEKKYKELMKNADA